MKMTAIQPESWKEDYRQFEQATEQFYSGEMDAKTYKGISGGLDVYKRQPLEFWSMRWQRSLSLSLTALNRRKCVSDGACAPFAWRI